jgi:hypothetical protein
MSMSTPWRRMFDAIEGPISAASQSWVQSETFMDLAAVTFKLQRRVFDELQRASEPWLHAFGMLSRADLTRLVNQVASLERHVRELERRLDSEHTGSRRAA